MNFEGSCLKAEAILNGTMDTINMDPLTTLFIEVLQYTSEPGVVDAKLTAEEFEGKVKAWDERTSTSPASNMHLGHVKAYYAKHLLDPGSKEEEQLDSQRKNILAGHLLLLS